MRIIIATLVSMMWLADYPVQCGRRPKRTDFEFSSDVDVAKYLQRRGKDMEIFKCKKVVMVQWLHSVVPYVDLQCEVLGEVAEVTWFFNDTRINTTGAGGRYISLSQPHYRKRVFYNKWFDYKLRMLHVTEDDNGPYTMKLRSPTGVANDRDIMLEVMTEYREDKWLKWMSQVDKDRSKRKNTKRSAAKMAKRRQKELMRQLRKRTHKRKSRYNGSLIFEGQ